VTIPLPAALLSVVAGCLGALVGSFLNVCIHRLPREMSVRHPARSFCPHCSRTIPWFHNLPVLSWLFLRGRCASCHQSIPVRYLLVECLTAALFACAAWRTGPAQPELLAAEVSLLSLLVAATFIDLEHLIIPDEITLGGVAAGLALSALWPQLQGETVLWRGLAFSCAGAAAGYGLLWAVAELGRLAMGRQRLTFDKPVPFGWKRAGDAAELTVEGESMDWAELFVRGSEQVRMHVTGGTLDGRAMGAGEWVWGFEKLQCAGELLDLNKVERIDLTITSLVLPREVMGYGDVKLLAAIGAFLGWKAVLFTVLTASILGAVLGVAALLSGRRDFATKIPFGPYLAAGAALWLFTGPTLLNAYWTVVTAAAAGPGQ
jgi:leader peptidase (prepilin peptidase) / N-methyltransferase